MISKQLSTNACVDKQWMQVVLRLCWWILLYWVHLSILGVFESAQASREWRSSNRALTSQQKEEDGVWQVDSITDPLFSYYCWSDKHMPNLSFQWSFVSIVFRTSRLSVSINLYSPFRPQCFGRWLSHFYWPHVCHTHWPTVLTFCAIKLPVRV